MAEAFRRWLWGRGWGASLPQTDLAALAPPPPPAPHPPEPPQGWSTALLEERHQGAHALVSATEGKWHCTRCEQTWVGRPGRTCWGLPRSTWATQPEPLVSLTRLWVLGLQPRQGPCGYRSLTTGRIVWLYDVHDAMTRPALTERQEALTVALPAVLPTPTGRRCSLCGARGETASWRCARCRAAQAQIALVRAALVTQRWAQGLLADPSWVLIRLIWRDRPAWEWSAGGGYRGYKGAWRLTLLAPDGTVLLDDLLAPVPRRRRVAPATLHTLTHHAATLAALRGKRLLVLEEAQPTARWLAERLRDECQPTWDATWVDVAAQTAPWLAQLPPEEVALVRLRSDYRNPQAELAALCVFLERVARDL